MQQSLFDNKSDLYNKFIKYHNANPEIYAMFKKFTIQAIQSGYKNFGSQMIIEKIRWETGVVARNDKFKIGNDYASFYSRMFMKEYPAYNNYFRIRSSVADELKLSDI
jgi:hypothetical protein